MSQQINGSHVATAPVRIPQGVRRSRAYLRLVPTMTHRLVLYSRARCDLCAEMRAVAAPIAAEWGLDIDTVDIDASLDLARRYNLAIPVLELDGREIARHRLPSGVLEQALADAAGA